MPYFPTDMGRLAQEIERVRQQQEAAKEEASNFRKLDQDGENLLRVLPTWRQDGAPPWKESWQHYIKQPTGGSAAYLCYERAFPSLGVRCPICNALESLRSHMDAGLDKLAAVQGFLVNTLWYTRNVAGYVLEREKPYITRFSISALRGMLDITGMPGIGHVWDPFQGYKLRVTRDRGYMVQAVPPAGPIADTPEGVEFILAQLHNLDAYVQAPTEQDLHEAGKAANLLTEGFARVVSSNVGLRAPQAPLRQPFGPPPTSPPAIAASFPPVQPPSFPSGGVGANRMPPPSSPVTATGQPVANFAQAIVAPPPIPGPRSVVAAPSAPVPTRVDEEEVSCPVPECGGRFKKRGLSRHMNSAHPGWDGSGSNGAPTQLAASPAPVPPPSAPPSGAPDCWGSHYEKGPEGRRQDQVYCHQCAYEHPCKIASSVFAASGLLPTTAAGLVRG